MAPPSDPDVADAPRAPGALPATPAGGAHAARGGWDMLIEWLLIGILAFAPLALGVVQAWSELAVLAAVAAMAGLLFLKLFVVRESRLAWSWCFVPIAAFLALVWAQSAAWPRAAVQRVAPRNVALRAELLGDLPAAIAAPDHVALSIYPDATGHDLRLLLACAAVFVVVVSVFRDRRQILRLLAAIVVIGAAVCLLSLAQHALGAQEIYWAIPTTPGARVDGGPFINHSHFAQFMNLSIGAGVALLLVQLLELKPRRRDAGWGGPGYAGVPAVPRTVWMLGAFVVIGFLSIALSMSRGGVLSGILAMMFIALILAMRREGATSPAATVLPLLGLAAFAAVLWVGFDALYDRFAAGGPERLGGRGQILRDASRLWADFPLLGTGQGTFEYAFPLVDRSTFPVRTTHAENEYAQILTETGALGLLLVFAFLALVGGAFVRCVRRQRSRFVPAAAYGLGFGMTAILLHSASDFGQHLPANAFLTSTCCGLIVSLSRLGAADSPRSGGTTSGARRLGPSRLPSLLAAGGILTLLVLSLPQASAARNAEDEWERATATAAEFEERGEVGTDEQYARVLAHAERAVAARPDSVEYRYGLNLHRWKSISRLVDEQGRPLMSPGAVEHTRRIVDELHGARALCPAFGSVYSLVGQLELFVLNRPGGAERIRAGYRLSPTDPSACFVAGQLAAREGAWDESLQAIRRAVQLDAARMYEATELYLSARRPMLAVAVAQGNAKALLTIAQGLEKERPGGATTAATTGETPLEVARAAREQAEALLRAEGQREGASAGALAAMANLLRDRKDFAAAIPYYRRALVSDYRQAGLRLELAKALAESGDANAAIREAEVVLRQRPGDAEATNLVERLRTEADPPGG